MNDPSNPQSKATEIQSGTEAGSSSASQEDLASSSLPEGAGLMTDEHGKQFVTVPQANGQVYAYPLEEYNKNPQAVMTGQAQASGAPVQAEPITPPPKRD